MTRDKLFDTMDAATFPHIRLARIWAQDEMWTQRAKGLSWADQRAWVDAYADRARAHNRRRLAAERDAAIAEREHSRELAELRQRRAALDMRPFGMMIEPERREIDQRIRAILTGRAA